jgi:tRNA (Thr-GGU) A37 N-methylase
LCYSHVWLSFKFHLNTNVLKQSKAFQGSTVTNGQPNGTFTFTAKITPPMLKKKVGVLSTRSPHRPNPIGITLAKIERVDKRTRTLHVSSCDLVHDTPILDIKPYVPFYDSIRDARVPTWIEESIDTRNTVTVAAGVQEKSERLLKKYCKLYRKDEESFWKG